MADAGVTLTIRPDGRDEIERGLGRIIGGLRQPVRLMQIIGAILESSTRHRFRTGVGPDGVAWKPSRRGAAGGKTLLATGRLRDSITHDADDTRAAVGTNVIYGRIHQLGGVIVPVKATALVFQVPGVGWRRVSKVTIPSRPYLGVSDSDRVEIADQVERYVARFAA